jgi:pyridoxal phosphate enzyme (YggS family)
MSAVAANLAGIRQQLGTTKLIAVSKMQDSDAVREALQAGQMIFGENRVQEAQKKFPELRQTYPHIELHLIGPLQTNKAQDAVETFDVIQTLDRPALADALIKATAKTGRKPRLYIEVNIGREAQKTGIAPEGLEFFLRQCRTKGLEISGLMCIPPLSQDPRPYFTRLKALADLHGLQHLSMGMSADYKIAIECGATEVRIGTAIFGSR